MMTHPELSEKEYKINDSTNQINDTYDKAQRASTSIIKNSLENTVNSLKKSRSKIPSMYKNLRNNLTLSANKLKKATEEHIANTGNHTAGGYAMSKRMNNDSAYLNELNSINQKEAEHLSEINKEIRNAYSDADTKIAESNYNLNRDKLSDLIKENERIDNLNYKITKDERDYSLDREKLSEEKRLNDSKIKINEDKHNLEMMYEPYVYEAKIEGLNKDNELTDAKITKTLSDASKKTTQKSDKSSSGLNLSAANIAKSIREQSTTYELDYKGKKVPVYDIFKAYTYLLSWKKKYNLSDQVVNDASVLLQVQGYF